MNIGLVLSGGMAKGAYQIGALKALGNFLPQSEIKYMSSASVGVLNGYAYATGKLNAAEEMWRNVCNDDSRLAVSKILKSSMLQQNINRIYSKHDKLSFTFYGSLLDISHKAVVYKNFTLADSSSIADYLKASVAMPVYNRAVTIDGVQYFDGAMIDNIPIFPLLKHSVDYVICIYFDDCCYTFENTYFNNKVIKLTFPCRNIFSDSMIFSNKNIEDMINYGYDYTSYIFNAVFAGGYANLDSIYNSIEYINSISKGSKLRITGDVLVTNLNKIIQKVAKQKIIL